MRLLLALLMLTLPLPAQSWQTIGYEWLNTFDFPAGTYTLQYGCTGKWSAPLTVTGPQTQRQLRYPAFGMKADVTGCPGGAGAAGQPAIQVQEQSSGFSIGVHAWNGKIYAAAVPLAVPASGAPPPAAPAPTSITIPVNGTCTATINGVSTPCTFTINANGSLVITASSLGITVTP